MRLASLVAATCLAGAVPAAAEAPVAPHLTYAFSARIELAPPIEQGEIGGGRRRFIPITGGTVQGPRFKGEILAGGGDWQTILPNGVSEIEARYFLKAEDGTVVGIRNPGVRVASTENTDRIARGEQVSADSYYFRTSPVFDPPPGSHGWMREKTFVGRGIRMPDHVVLEVFIVE